MFDTTTPQNLPATYFLGLMLVCLIAGFITWVQWLAEPIRAWLTRRRLRRSFLPNPSFDDPRDWLAKFWSENRKPRD